MRLRTATCLCGPRVRSRQSFFAQDAGRGPVQRGRADPTGTAKIQRQWSRDLDQRWRTIKLMLPRAIEDRMSPVNHIMHSALTGKADPVQAFQGWLDEAMRQIVLGINGAWLLPYVRQATDVGALHARSATTTSVSDGSPDQPRGPDGQWTESGGSVVAYHGTTNEVAADILKNGIKINQSPSFSDKDLYHDDRGRSVYVARTESIAEYYAKERVHNKGGTPVLFELRIPKKDWEEFQNDNLSSYGTRFGAAHRPKNIPPEWIVGHREIKDAVDDDYVTVYLVLSAPKKTVSDAAPQDRTHLLQSLAIAELQGIIEAVSQRVVRAFANGYLARKSPSAISTDCKQTIDAVGVQRGRLLAGFMVVRAHAAATLDGFRARGVRRVGLVPERVPPVSVIRDAVFPSLSVTRAENKLQRELGGVDVDVLTAGDDDVCEECQDIAANGPYTLDEAESLIPAHPLCRCGFMPADEDEDDEINDSDTHIASGVMITADNTGRTLFLRRAGTGDETGTWAFPGGAVEPGETLEQAAARETREEIGYDPGVDALEQAHRGTTNDVDFTTYMHATPREFRPHLNGEHDAYKWSLLEQAPEPLHPGVERTLDDMDNALRTRDLGETA